MNPEGQSNKPSTRNIPAELHPGVFAEQMGLQALLQELFANTSGLGYSMDDSDSRKITIQNWNEMGYAEAFKMWAETHSSSREVYTRDDVAEIFAEIEDIRKNKLLQ